MADSIYTFDPTAASNTALDSIAYGPNQLYHSNIDNLFRAFAAKLAQHVDDLGGVNTVGGTANALTATIASGITAYATGQLFWFKNTPGPNTTAATMNVNAIGDKEIRLQGDSALEGGEMLDNGYYGLLYDAAYDGAAGGFILLNPATSSVDAATTSAAGIVALNYFGIAQNIGFAASVGSSALTIALKGADGNDPSASNPVIVPFRNVTAATGTPTFLTITAATSIVISSGSTLGMTSGVAATLAIVGFNDGGTFRLGLINPLVLPLNDGIASSTAEGGAGAADSAGVIYTGTAVSSKAMTVLGYATVTEATAGTWATAPATLKLASASEVNDVVPIITPWVDYTPTFTALGTPSSVKFSSRRVGSNLQVRGKFTAGTTTGSTVGITIGFNGGNANVVSSSSVVTSLQVTGVAAYSITGGASLYMLIDSATSTMNVGAALTGRAGLAAVPGTALLNSGDVLSLTADIPIDGWQ